MMKQYALLFLVYLFYTTPTFAGELKGHITDKNGVALPFATVFVKGTTIGTSANANGDYQLTLAEGKYTIACAYIGYTQSSFTLAITADEHITHNFSLADESLNIKEYTVKAGDDPALYIMRKVIARRSFHLKQIKAFQTDIYLKGTVRSRNTPDEILGQKIEKAEMGLDTNGFGIMYLAEEDATYYAQGNKKRTIIHSVKESGNPSGVGFSQFPEVVSFYENNIPISDQIAPRGFISPVSDFALNYYKYKLEGDFKEGNHTIYKLSILPKRQYEPLFTSGVIYVVDDEWALQSLNVLATKKSNMQMLDTLRIEQVYLPYKKDEWVIKQQVIYPTLNILGFDISGNFVTVYSNQKINEPVPDTIFNDKIISSYDKTANKKDTNYFNETRPIPLDIGEAKDYVEKDSLRKITENPAHIDSMRCKGNKIGFLDVLVNGIRHNGKGYKLQWQTNALMTGLINFNTVEGINVAPKIYLRYSKDTFHVWRGALAPRYGFTNSHFNAIGKISYTSNSRSWRSKYWTAGLEGGKYVFQFNPHNPIEGLYNTISTLFYRKNYLKLYERWSAKANFGMNHGNGIRWNMELGFQQRIPLVNTDYSTFAKTGVGGFTDNIPTEFKNMLWEKHNAVIAKIAIAYQPGYKYVKYPDYLLPIRSNWPTFTLSYEKGIPNILNSKTDFDKWRLGITHEIGLRLLGNLGLNVAAGGFLSDKYVSIPDLNHIQGNQIILASPYLESFQTAPYYLYSNKKPLYGEAHAEWKLQGFLTNKIPLLRQLQWYLVTGGNLYYADQNLYHAEAFVGIDNIGFEKLRFFRVDFVQSWNSFNQRVSAVRIGIATNSLFRFDLSDSQGEW